ncbi:heterodisulfide reductase-related iron-sulfur binding cluster [Chloroflexota bacterium]
MNKWNLDQARMLGPKRVVYLCQWCAYIAKRFCSGDDTDLIYYLSILVEHVEKLKKAKLRLPPTRVGYFEGCHLRNVYFTPGVEIPWKSYRQLLEIIDEVEIVDLPSWKCCAHPHNEQIVEEAQKLGLSGIVTPCQGCWSWLERIGFKKGLPVKMLQEVVLEAVDHVTGQNLSRIG